MRRRPPFLVAVFVLLTAAGCASTAPIPEPASMPPSATAAEVVAHSVRAADRLLAELSRAQRARILHDVADDEQRGRWSNLPSRMAPRGGLRTGDLTLRQRQAVMGLVASLLSERGYRTILENVHGDQALGERGRSRVSFGRDEFHVAILGTPSARTPWMFQFGGHHLGVNATVVGERVTLSPLLTGGQPMVYRIDGKRVRQMDDEWGSAVALVRSLDEGQRRVAILGDTYVDWTFGPGVTGAVPRREGLAGAAMTPAQRATLVELIEARVGVLHPALARRTLDRIERELDDTYVCWYGPVGDDGAATYRVQGPSVIIEYAPQALGGRPADHVHAIYRDPTNEYGAADRAAFAAASSTRADS